MAFAFLFGAILYLSSHFYPFLVKDRTRRNLDDQLREGNAPGFSIPLVMKRARPGESVVFECLPYGKPFPTIKWLKDGIELVPGDGITIESLDDGTQRLTLDNVEFLSEGYYRCVATNPHGTASTKAELVLTGLFNDSFFIPLVFDSIGQIKS